MSWFWTIISLVLALIISSEAKQNHHQKPSAVIVGTVYCDTCFQHNSPKPSNHFISGASVAVECMDTTSTPRFRAEVKTDSHGEFKVKLPFTISKHVEKIKGCSVKLLSSNKPYCSIAASATSSNIHLKSRKEGTHVFSAGFFTFRPLKQPEVCDQKPRINNHFKKLPLRNAEKLPQNSNPNDPAFLPPIQDPPSNPPALGGFLPPLPRLPPLPQLPHLPPLPGLPFLPPVPKKEAANKTPNNGAVNHPDIFPFPPNPINTPTLFPPFNPPSGIPTIFPPFAPVFPLPSSPPLFNLPPFPGLFPLQTPPSLSLPRPLPPFPFQPTRGSAGVPPAGVSRPSKTSSP